MRRLTMILGILAALTAPAQADPQEANRLLVEAILLSAQAARAPREEAIQLYAQAAANLDAIVADHPESDHAALIATNQPIGAFRTWEVRHELARLSADPAQPAAAQPGTSGCAEPCVWEHQVGETTGNPISGGSALILADLLLRPDGTAVAVGAIWSSEASEIWLAAFAPDGERLWEQTYAGRACSAALIDDGFVVLAEKLVNNEEAGVLMLLDDGTAPTGFPLPFEANGIASDGTGGFLLLGRSDGGDAMVARYDATGDTLWQTTIDTAAVSTGSDGDVVFDAAAVPGTSEIRVLGLSGLPDGGRAVVWTGTLDLDGAVGAVTALDEVQPLTHPTCDPVLRYASIDAAGDGFLLRYDSIDAGYSRRVSTVLRTDAAGGEIWRRVLPPTDPPARPDPEILMRDGVDEVTAVAPTADGGALVAGLRVRPMGRGAGYVARWDADGETVWSTELRRTPEDQVVRDAFFSALAETADGGVLATMTDGVVLFRMRAFLFRLGAGGEAP